MKKTASELFRNGKIFYGCERSSLIPDIA